MYNGLEIIDFHVHFPTQARWIIERGPDMRGQYAERLGERRAKIAREHAMAYNRQWRATWGFDPPERGDYSDEEQADRWAAEIERYGLRAVGFVTGGGNKNLARSSGGIRRPSSASPITTFSAKAPMRNCAAPSMRTA